MFSESGDKIPKEEQKISFWAQMTFPCELNLQCALPSRPDETGKLDGGGGGIPQIIWPHDM